MSALDQAFIKAYAKDQPAQPFAAQGSSAVAAARRPAPAPPATRDLAVEQIYHDGSLYRVETPQAGQRREAGIPAPHHSHLPPTSPRRGIRRSLLRFLAGQNSAAALPEPSIDAPPRVARKVIIRHVAHGALPAPQRIPFDVTAGPASQVLPFPTNAELPPESIQPGPFDPSTDDSVQDPAPVTHVVPLNENLIITTDIPELACWDGQAVPALVLIEESADISRSISEALVTVRLDAIPLPAEAGQLQQEEQTAELAESAHFAGKSLDDVDLPPTRLHIDPPHAASAHRPHVHFGSSAQVAANHKSPSAAITSAPASDELCLAEIVEPLASDLIPQAIPAGGLDDAQAAGDAESPASKSTAPLWEVDRFQWPKTCQKLLADQNGYFAHAGEKLAAAVQDGLRVLAVTGSRRGEGRTTLSLCLAHAAAKAGIHVAVMETDFARPQLASKLGLDIAFGWQDAALGRIPLSEAAIKSLSDGITALPLEPSAVRQELSLADPRMTATIRAAAATFELVILDFGPLGAEALAFPPGERCPLDAAIVVRDLRFATALESDAVGRRLQEAGVEAVGVAENFVVEEPYNRGWRE